MSRMRCSPHPNPPPLAGEGREGESGAPLIRDRHRPERSRVCPQPLSSWFDTALSSPLVTANAGSDASASAANLSPEDIAAFKAHLQAFALARHRRHRSAHASGELSVGPPGFDAPSVGRIRPRGAVTSVSFWPPDQARRRGRVRLS